MRLAALLALIVLSGCASLPRAPTAATSYSLPSSHAVTMGQLVIYSDQPLPRHHRLLEELDMMRTELLGQFGLPLSDEPIYVYLFGTPERFAAFQRQNHPDFVSRRALFVQGDTRLTVYAQWGDNLAEDLRHEVAHGYLHSVAPAIPLWLDEGLAECSEVPRAQDLFHAPHYALLMRKLREGWKPNLPRLESLNSAADMTQLEYAESWAWTHFLIKSSPERRMLLASYLQEVRRSGRTPPLTPHVMASTRPMDCHEMLLGHLQSLAPKYAAAIDAMDRDVQ